jgi:hypothetical protein
MEWGGVKIQEGARVYVPAFGRTGLIRKVSPETQTATVWILGSCKFEASIEAFMIGYVVLLDNDSAEGK